MNQDPKHSVRRIVLPSGKSIEVVRFNDDVLLPPAASTSAPTATPSSSSP